MKVRFVRVRLPTGEWEVLATALREEALYPTGEFLTVYHGRWGHATFYRMLKGRLEPENFRVHPRSWYLEWCRDRSLRMKKFSLWKPYEGWVSVLIL